jgi:hypothetical protein
MRLAEVEEVGVAQLDAEVAGRRLQRRNRRAMELRRRQQAQVVAPRR